jgi:hypothetical protein
MTRGGHETYYNIGAIDGLSWGMWLKGIGWVLGAS